MLHHQHLRLIAAACIAAAATAHPAGKAGGTAFPLTVDSIMRGPKLVGYPPGGLRWSGDSARLYFEWRRPGEDEASTWVVNREGGEPRKLSDAERRKAPGVAAVWDAAHRRALFVDEGDIAIVDSVTGTRRNVTRTTADEGNPRWARHETAVTFTRENNLFIVPLDANAADNIAQLTDVQPHKRDPRETDNQKFVKTEEAQLIEHTRTEAEKKKQAEEKKKARALPKFELQDRQNAADLQLAPDDKHVFIIVVERSDGAKRAEVPNYVTESGYVEGITGRTFVGDTQDKRQLVVMNLETGKSEKADGSFSASRDVRWSMPVLFEDGALAVASVRSADNKDRWLVAVDLETGKTRVIDALHDDAWIREVGSSNSGEPSSFGWLPNEHRIWLLSERDGFMHLYSVDPSATQQSTQLTRGKWEIESVVLSPDKRTFYLTTNEVHPGERHIYAMPTQGGDRTRLTTMPGSNTGEVSPDGKAVGLIYSYSNKPPEVYVVANASSPTSRQVTTTPIEEWRSFKWIDPHLVTYKARDGAEVYARLFTPEMIGARRDPNAPAVVFVHGAGYFQNAHKYWSTGYYREYMFHNLLASKGYVVLDPDYRASAGYGRDWRTAIYRHMGGKDLEDVIDGARYLVDKEKVNAKRIGVYGGSYGGFITLMALFTSPDTFAAGAALRPVTDWSRYNHGYTSSILNEPQKDAEAYRRSSPIYFAGGLKSALLICHGMVDTNVFFQDTVRLVQRLVELRKENWSVAFYPVENHAFEEETSWADEYKRILKLFDENLVKAK